MVETETSVKKIADLLHGLAPATVLRPRADEPVSGVYADSRQVQPGSVFVAVRGTQVDGRRFVEDALARGASVVVGEEIDATEQALIVNVPDARTALATLALRWHGLTPESGCQLKLLGVTGTNGKSTTALMTRAILQTAGLTCGLLGTVHYELCGRRLAAPMTTPGPLELAAYLRECADAGADAVVLEVSSHALDQKRTDGLRFAAAAFTNLSGDHLDYHGTFEDYRRAKARLFARLSPTAFAVVNADDENHAFMVDSCPARVLTYGLGGEVDIRASIESSSMDGTVYQLWLDGVASRLENAFVGRHNVYNAIAAVGLARSLGVARDDIAAGLRRCPAIPGRLQRVPCDSPAHVFVDYAHSDDALRTVLSALRPLTDQRLIVVFGCGGDRDRSKRPRMARVAAECADAVVVTTDNPRHEDPGEIIAEVLGGFDAEARQRVVVEPDRARAIRAALAMARHRDIVLIAGKGHETVQIIGDRRTEFDDVAVAIGAAAEFRRSEQGGA